MTLLPLSLMLSACAGNTPAQSETSPAPAEALTLKQLADYFVSAADDYNLQAERTAVLEGLDENKMATRLELFVLAGRAFGNMRVLSSKEQSMAPAPVDLSDAPEWTWSVLRNLSDGGILAASDLGLPELQRVPEENESDARSEDIEKQEQADSSQTEDMDEDPVQLSETLKTNGEKLPGTDEMNAPVTFKDAEILAQRFYQSFAAQLKDNFYAAVNKGEMEALELPEDGSVVGGSSAVAAKTDSQLHALILEIVNGEKTYAQGSPEQKIQALYQNVLNLENRNAKGIEPLRKYLDAVEAAQNFSELNAAIALAVNELGNLGNGLFPMLAVTDTQDSSKKVMQLMTLTPMFSAADYADSENEQVQEYRKAMIDRLVTAGENEKTAKQLADGILAMEKALSEQASSDEELGDLQRQTNRYTPASLDALMPQARPSELLAAIGLPADVSMQVFDDKQFAAYAEWFTAENLELFKAIQKSTLIGSFSQYLSEELAERFGYPGDAAEEANQAVQSFLSEELGQLYVNRYFSAESKAEIEKMVQQMIEAFKARINRLDWMEESTRQEAVKKLDNMTVLIGYPDQWDWNTAEIQSASEGGSYFANVTASEAVRWQKMVQGLNEPVNPRRFPMAAYTVNAAASRSTNTLIFPAGILQAPFYDASASFEANLGAIGSTIAHEITHMFDDGGALYDATGTVRNWWSDNDFAHFQELCQKVEAFYEGYEAAPGIPVDGQMTLSENIADIGGIACGLEILSAMENPDYDAFFRSFANQWVRMGEYATLADLAQTDAHAPNNLRVNRVLPHFQEFYDTYNIQPQDGMYVAPQDRIQIW